MSGARRVLVAIPGGAERLGPVIEVLSRIDSGPWGGPGRLTCTQFDPGPNPPIWHLRDPWANFDIMLRGNEVKTARWIDRGIGRHQVELEGAVQLLGGSEAGREAGRVAVILREARQGAYEAFQAHLKCRTPDNGEALRQALHRLTQVSVSLGNRASIAVAEGGGAVSVATSFVRGLTNFFAVHLPRMSGFLPLAVGVSVAFFMVGRGEGGQGVSKIFNC